MTHSSDRNLLFGILALQMDFVTRDQLIAAMNAWVLDKGRSLADILLKHDAFEKDTYPLLNALVEKHLEMHGNDPQQSLAAVSSIGSLRNDLISLADAEVEATLGHVAIDPPAATSDLPETISAGRSSSTGARFRVLRPHAKGGLGAISVASDEELHREVALKEIQQQFASDPDSRARFIQEAEITGGLEHPGIVPVYGLGQYDDGRPFYAMRFVRGDSLKEAVRRYHDSRRAGSNVSTAMLAFRQLLGRFVDVCNAVEYAHSRGVLHRDLKPGNIMLGKYGETLVVDWGLAKIVGRKETHATSAEHTLKPSSGGGSSPTHFGAAVGTPGFMSPEQAEGRLDQLGPASDVYSLGATLYHVLAGKVPFGGNDVEDVLRRVQVGDFPTPRSLDPAIPRPLEAICLKAMARKPRDRYASPRELADDVERWLADEPVTAYQDPPVARASRWARRHKVAVAATMALLLTVLVGVSIGAILLAKANRNIRSANELARQNEAIASQNFQMAQQAVDDYMTTVSEETLLGEPGMQPLRSKLLDHALQYYRSFITQKSDDPQLQFELGRANLLVGRISQQIGSYQEAVEAFNRAINIHEQLLPLSPGQLAVARQAAECYEALGSALVQSGQMSAAEAAYAAALSLLQPLRKKEPDNPGVLKSLESLSTHMGALKHDRGQFDDAHALYEQSRELCEKILAVVPDDTRARDSLAAAFHNLASLARETGKQGESVSYLQQAIAIREKLVEEHPRHPFYQEKLALSYDSLGNTLRELGRPAEAINIYQQATTISEQLVAENPAIPAYRNKLASEYSNLASAYRDTGQDDESTRLNLQANKIWQDLVRQYPAIVDYRKTLGMNYYNTGNQVLDAGPSQAVEYYRQAIDVQGRLVADFPDVFEYRGDLAQSYNNCAAALDLLKDGEAEAMHHQALALREQLVKEQPDLPELRNQLASSYFNLARFSKTADEKYALIRKSIEVREALVTDFPAVPDYKSKLAFSSGGLALEQFAANQSKSSLPAFRRTIELYEELHAQFPDVSRFRAGLFQFLSVYAVAQRLSGEWQGAVEAESRIVALCDRLLTDDPDKIQYRLLRANGLAGMGKSYQKGAALEQAAASYSQAIDVLRPLIDAPSGTDQARKALPDTLELRAGVLERLQRYGEAVRDISELIEFSDQKTRLRVSRARLKSLAGSHQEAAAEIDEVLGAGVELANIQLYNAACTYALAVAAAERDGSLDADDRKSLQERYSNQSMEILRKVEAAGYFTDKQTAEHLSTDTDLEPIRESAAFQEFLGRIRSGEHE